jgi:hypothetical protein
LRASARTGIWLRCQPKRIAANSSTLLGPIPAPPKAEEHPIQPTIHPGVPSVPQPPGVSPRRSAGVGPNHSATPPPRPPLVGPDQRRTVGPLQSATAMRDGRQHLSALSAPFTWLRGFGRACRTWASRCQAEARTIDRLPQRRRVFGGRGR